MTVATPIRPPHNMTHMYCATCGKKRGPLEQQRESWGIKCGTALVPRRDDVEAKPWQMTNDLIYHAGVWRNGGTNEVTHLCDDCLRIGLRAIKLKVDELLEAIEADKDKDAELAAINQKLGLLQHKVHNMGVLEAAGIPDWAWNHQDFLKDVAQRWRKHLAEFRKKLEDDK